jgi:hypothetical protein
MALYPPDRRCHPELSCLVFGALIVGAGFWGRSRPLRSGGEPLAGGNRGISRSPAGCPFVAAFRAGLADACYVLCSDRYTGIGEGATCQSTLAEGFYRFLAGSARSGRADLFFGFIALTDLTTNLTPNSSCRVDIGIGAVGVERVRERVEIARCKKLRCHRNDAVDGNRAGHRPTIRGACRGVGHRAWICRGLAEPDNIPPLRRASAKWM